MLNARQLGLKLIANTTYGYTGASFCGRMPCIEVADSIVRKGRETLELAIQMVNSSPEWRAKVVYGDTDSLFVLLKGASKEEAFRIGKEICDRITESNPKPVKLKFEKVSKKNGKSINWKCLLIFLLPLAVAMVSGVSSLRSANQETLRRLYVRIFGSEGTRVRC